MDRIAEPLKPDAANFCPISRRLLERIRGKNTQLILNVTTGPGGCFVPSEDDPKVAGAGTTPAATGTARRAHPVLRPDICTLDLNTMNSGKQAVINTPGNVRRMAKVINDAGAKPELELFDSGDIALMHDLLKDGTLRGPVHIVCDGRAVWAPAITLNGALRTQPLVSRRPIYGHRHRTNRLPVRRALLPRWRTCSALALKTRSISPTAGLPPPMRPWSRRPSRIVEDLGGQITTPREARDIIGLPTQLVDAKPIALGTK
jgi:hypothetical protein